MKNSFTPRERLFNLMDMSQRIQLSPSALALICAGILAIFSITVHPIQSDDLFMYLAIARDYFQNGSFSPSDPFLYSISDSPWVTDHQWLGYLIFYKVFSILGYNGLIAIKSLMIAFAFALGLPKVQNSLTAYVWSWFVFFGVLALASRTMERTSQFSDLFSVITLTILLGEQSKPNRWKYFLPVLFLAWVNIHPGFPVGWLFIALFLISNPKKLKSPQWPLLFLSTLLVCWFNPRGFQGIIYPFSFAQNEATVFRKYYFEWMPTFSELFFYSSQTVTVVILIASFLILTLWQYRQSKLNLFAAASGVFLIGYGLSAIRFIPVMAIGLTLLSSEIAKTISLKRRLIPLWLPTACLLAFSIKNIFWGYSVISGPRVFGGGLDLNAIPVAAAEKILKFPQLGNVFNSHLFGNYLAWAWNHERKVFYHGFVTDTDFYLNEYLPALQSPAGFYHLQEKFQFRAAIVDRFAGSEILLDTLQKDPNWRLVHLDASSVVFLAKPQ